MKKTVTAYCFISGHIDFGGYVPEGAFGLAEGEDRTVRQILATHAESNKRTLFVPGVRTAQGQREGITAIAQFIQLLGENNQSGFRALGV